VHTHEKADSNSDSVYDADRDRNRHVYTLRAGYLHAGADIEPDGSSFRHANRQPNDYANQNGHQLAVRNLDSHGHPDNHELANDYGNAHSDWHVLADTHSDADPGVMRRSLPMPLWVHVLRRNLREHPDRHQHRGAHADEYAH